LVWHYSAEATVYRPVQAAQKKPGAIYEKLATRLSAWDPWLSVPTLRWVWQHMILAEKREKPATNVIS
jgi:hypothetical protein